MAGLPPKWDTFRELDQSLLTCWTSATRMPFNPLRPLVKVCPNLFLIPLGCLIMFVDWTLKKYIVMKCLQWLPYEWRVRETSFFFSSWKKGLWSPFFSVECHSKFERILWSVLVRFYIPSRIDVWNVYRLYPWTHNVCKRKIIYYILFPGTYQPKP